uniref:Odorant receptor n=1 Tax=Bradysia odoriphaga TaxID=1564500 RepID=A0A6B9C775_9DIPT|nr:odorant receptor 21 [Bradysia odoriphaga]
MTTQILQTERFTAQKYFFRVQKWGWKVVGFWPGMDNIPSLRIGLAIANSIEVLIYSVFQLMYCYESSDNLVFVLDALTPVLTQITTAMKVLIIVARREDLKFVLDYLKQSFYYDKSRESLKIHGRASIISFTFGLTLAVFANLTNLFFCLLPMVKDSYRLVMGIERSYDLPFKAVFPFNIFWSPLFEFIFVTSAYSGIMTATSIYSTDGLFLGICAHISSEFKIIGSRVSTLIEEEIGSHQSIEKFSKEQNDRLYKKLTIIVDDHSTVIDVCQKMSRCLSPNVLIHYFTSAVITCICCLMILLAEGAAKIIFVNYIIASTTQVFVYSIGGNMLEDASTGIYFTAYDFPWYKCDERIRRTIQMIMIRSQRKTAIDVPFFEASLETFSVIIRTAGSYIALLNTFL